MSLARANRAVKAPLTMSLSSIRPTMTGPNTRRKRLAAKLAGEPFFGNQQRFATSVGLTRGRISQLLNPAQPFGEAAARELESRAGWPEGWLDGFADAAAEAREPPPSYGPSSASQLEVIEVSDTDWTMLTLFQLLPEEVRQGVLDEIYNKSKDQLSKMAEVMQRLGAPKPASATRVSEALPQAPTLEGETPRTVRMVGRRRPNK
jgi:hypothetical protein